MVGSFGEQIRGSVDVGDIWLDPVDAVIIELFVLSCMDHDGGLLNVDGVTVGWVYVEPTIPPHITYPRVL